MFNVFLSNYFSKYMKLVIMFFIVSVLNNYALNFNISMPLHMIFRAVTISFAFWSSLLLLSSNSYIIKQNN